MTHALKTCSECGGQIVVTETVNANDVIYRMRKCKPCDWVIVTEEKVSDVQMIPHRFRQAKRLPRS